MKIERKEYYCPACKKGFEVAQTYVLPCCFKTSDEIEDGTQREKCRACGKIWESDYMIAVCPHCDNDGSDYPEPGYWECMQSYIEDAEQSLSVAEGKDEASNKKRRTKTNFPKTIIED